jgi:hypothetical protein
VGSDSHDTWPDPVLPVLPGLVEEVDTALGPRQPPVTLGQGSWTVDPVSELVEKAVELIEEKLTSAHCRLAAA